MRRLHEIVFEYVPSQGSKTVKVAMYKIRNYNNSIMLIIRAKHTKILSFIIISLLLGKDAYAREIDQKILALNVISTFDQRVASISHKIDIASLEFCSAVAARPGFTIHHLSQYSPPFRSAAQKHFGLDREVRVLAIASGGPADKAGLKTGDIVEAVDGVRLPVIAAEKNRASTSFSEIVDQKIEAEFEDGSARLLVKRGAAHKTILIEAEPGCRNKVSLKPSSKLNAYADGTNVVLTTGIVSLAKDDAELAAILAHELAHNILGHRAVLDVNGRSRRLMRHTEFEADRLSIRLLDAAGFSPDAALRFWRRYGPLQNSLFSKSRHPPWRSRIKAMATEIEALKLEKPN